MFYLYQSNRQENLVKRLGDHLEQTERDPLKTQTIICENRGMARWVAIELASRFGVMANVEFPYPLNFSWQVFEHIVPVAGRESSSPFNPGIMKWRIMRLLPGLLENKEFQPIKQYLEEEEGLLRRYQLAGRVAALFDRYLDMRPEMVREWEKNRRAKCVQPWQPVLWNALMDELSSEAQKMHRLRILDKALKEIKSNLQKLKALLPDDIHVFGIASLNRPFLELLQGLAAQINVHFYMHSPCSIYWGDAESPAERIWRHKRLIKQGVTDPEKYDVPTNYLLGSMGRLGRDLHVLMCDAEKDEGPDEYVEMDPGNMLENIQIDLLKNLESEMEKKVVVSPDDRSIQIHSCHSPMREVEVLRDHLLRLFDAKNGEQPVNPRDVLVMCPDIREYAPFIQAIFSDESAGRKRIPFNLANRRACDQSSVIQTWLRLLKTAQGRLGVTEVLDLMECKALRRKFGLSLDDVEKISTWVRSANIRWGVDGAFKEKWNIPATHQNTWLFGLNRLLLGYAMPLENRRIMEGINPVNLVEGGEALILGKFMDFAHRLFDLALEIGKRVDAEGWGRILSRVTRDFFEARAREDNEITLILTVVSGLVMRANAGGFEETMDLPVVLDYLEAELGGDHFRTGFMNRGVTFCSIQPMRSIPFKVICMIGMNEGALPRRMSHDKFDLILSHKQPGDRVPAWEDHYVFLEALLCARNMLYLSYVGRDRKDDSEKQPSILISELMDYLDMRFEVKTDKYSKIKDLVVTQERLQAFNTAYFSGTDTRFFSYSEENCKGAKSLAKAATVRSAAPPEKIAPPAEDDWKMVDLQSFIRFFENPCRHFLYKRVGVFLAEPDAGREDTEDYEIHGLDRYILKDELIRAQVSKTGTDLSLENLGMAGKLPCGRVGMVEYGSLEGGASVFAEQVNKLAPGELESRKVLIRFDRGLTLWGSLGNESSSGIFHFRPVKPGYKAWLRLWLCHLVYCSSVESVSGIKSTFLGNNGETLTFRGVEKAHEVLQELMELYEQGQCGPVKFLPETSWAWYNEMHKSGDSAKAHNKAMQVWYYRRSDFGGRDPETADPYMGRYFGDESALDKEFEKIAEKIWKPCFEHRI